MKYLLLISLYLIGTTLSYNPSAAVNYARQWAYSRNPSYHDYSGEGGDCANFVSQCLIAGGLGISNCAGSYGQGGTIPYVPNLENCLVAKGWKRSSSMPSQGVPAGSVITFYNGGHAVLVVQGGTSPLVAAHTTDVYAGNGIYGYGRKYFWDPSGSDSGGSISWYPYVNGYNIYDVNNGYAGDFGNAVVALKVQGATYTVHETGGSWLSEVSNDQVAGRGNPLDGVAIKGGVEYRVHILGGGWLEPVTGYDLNDEDYGFAGILGQTIDAVAINGKTYASGY